MNMEEIVALSVKHNVSDLHLCSAWPARWRIRGRMEAAPFDAPDVEELLREWLDDDQRAILLENGQLDFAVSLAENQRLRGSAFAQRQGISLALRLLPSHCPQLEQLGAPPVLPELLKSENGLILVTGATGSGKIYHAGGDGWLSQSTCRCAYSDAGRSCGISLYQSAMFDPAAGDWFALYDFHIGIAGCIAGRS